MNIANSSFRSFSNVKAAVAPWLCAAALGAAALFPQAASAQFNSQQFLPVPQGLWVINTFTGTISFCSNVKSSVGAPQGKCAHIGSTGLNGVSYSFWAAGNDIFVMDSWRKTILQCVANVNPTTFALSGSCKAVSDLAQM